MEEAGIDISIFKAHSVRGGASFMATGAGVTSKDILDAADWSSEGTFQRFYYRQLGVTDPPLVYQFSHLIRLKTIHVDTK